MWDTKGISLKGSKASIPKVSYFSVNNFYVCSCILFGQISVVPVSVYVCARQRLRTCVCGGGCKQCYTQGSWKHRVICLPLQKWFLLHIKNMSIFKGNQIVLYCSHFFFNSLLHITAKCSKSVKIRLIILFISSYLFLLLKYWACSNVYFCFCMLLNDCHNLDICLLIRLEECGENGVCLRIKVYLLIYFCLSISLSFC